MFPLLCEIHFWSTQEDVIVKHTDYGAFKYYSKRDLNDSLSCLSKKKYCEQRDYLWNLPNKRPQRVRDKLKELEDYLLHNKIVCFEWPDAQLLQLLLSTGVLVNIKINTNTGDLLAINFEKQLASKLQVNILCDGVILGQQQIICICNDGHVLGYGGPWRDGWIVEGGPRRRLNYFNDWLAVWGKIESEHPQPWSPLGKDYQRANLHLYWINYRGAELLAYKKTDGDPIDVIVSRYSNNRTLILIEQKVTIKGSVSIEISNFELIKNNLKRITVTSVPLQTQVSCCCLSKHEDRLLIGCIDGSLALLDRNRGITKTIKALFIPKFIEWHPLGTIVVITNERGQLQYFDIALNCIKTQIISEDCTPIALIDLSSYFNAQLTINSISWGQKDLILSLEQGPLVLIKHIEKSLTIQSIIYKYIKTNKIDKAIRLLLSCDFNEQSFYLLQKISTYLLTKPMTQENAKYLQDVLGYYYSPPIPIPTNLRNRFNNQILSISRRFFHQLVRTEMFEIAFLLAVDLQHHDLFMDLYYIAIKIGETEMAAAARAQASALLSHCSSELSNCSRSSCSQCSNDDDDDDSCSDHNDDVQNYQTTTNFNQSYISSPPVPNLLTNRPRATYVKAPQVPLHFTNSNPIINNNGGNNINKINSSVVKPTIIPPLPVTPPLPYLGNTNLRLPNHYKLSINQSPSSSFCYNNSIVNSGVIKKVQPKVKFSDTVTAFIVPEIKRPSPIRQLPPPLPSHLTDPQKELADSLPLCHPNEEYLKDFTPIRKNDNSDDSGGIDNTDDNEQQQQQQPKIKVVHFGVV